MIHIKISFNVADLPLSLSVGRDLLRILLVMSGMVFLLVKFNSDFPMEESFEDLKLNEGTDALKIHKFELKQNIFIYG